MPLTMLILLLLALGCAYGVNLERNIVRIKPILLPFIILLIMFAFEIISEKTLPVVSIISLAIISFIVWLVRRNSL